MRSALILMLLHGHDHALAPQLPVHEFFSFSEAVAYWRHDLSILQRHRKAQQAACLTCLMHQAQGAVPCGAGESSRRCMVGNVLAIRRPEFDASG